MSKRVNISYLFSIMLLLLTGCEQETSLAPSPIHGEEPVEILLSANVVQVSASILTRSDFLNETSFKDGTRKVGVFGLRTQDGSFTDYPYVNNFALTNSSDGTLSGDDGQIYFPAGYGTITAYLYGYYPYTAEAELVSQGNDILIPVKSGLSGVADGKWTNAGTDPLHATAAPTIERVENAVNERPSIPVTLTFKHMMAQLQIFVNTATSDKYRLQEIITTFSKHQHGYMNVRNGEITSADSNSETITETFPSEDFIGAATATAQSIHSVLPGIDAIQKIEVKIKIDGEENGKVYEAFNAATANKSINLTAGSITAVTINFNPNTATQASLDDTWNITEEHSFDFTN